MADIGLYLQVCSWVLARDGYENAALHPKLEYVHLLAETFEKWHKLICLFNCFCVEKIALQRPSEHWGENA